MDQELVFERCVVPDRFGSRGPTGGHPGGGALAPPSALIAEGQFYGRREA